MQHLDGSHPSRDRSIIRKARDFCVMNDLLYRHNYAPEGRRWLLVVPGELRGDILHYLQDDGAAGHLGLFKTYSRIRHRFFWPGMYRSVCKYVRSCTKCQRRKRPSLPTAGLLQPLPAPSRPFEVVGSDFFGPLPTSSGGNRWIIVVIDHATRYVETASLSDGTAEATASFILHNIILRHGAPRTLISDPGRSFLSKTVSAILRASNVVHRTTTPYHPQTNGLTERFNYTLANMISMYVAQDHRNWDTILPFITFAYNTAVQSTTGFSPLQLLYGRQAA